MRLFWLSLLLGVVAAAGCGQRGELYLRDDPPPGVRPPKPESYPPVPYREPADDGAEKKR